MPRTFGQWPTRRKNRIHFQLAGKPHFDPRRRMTELDDFARDPIDARIPSDMFRTIARSAARDRLSERWD
jgi:hypothetical protein